MINNNLIQTTITSVKKSLILYKSMSYMYPDWFGSNENIYPLLSRLIEHERTPLGMPDEHKTTRYVIASTAISLNDSLNHSLNDALIGSADVLIKEQRVIEEIAHYLMTRTITEQYNSLPNYRSSINNPFNRAIWHMLYAITEQARYVISNKNNPSNLKRYDFEKVFDSMFKMLDVFCVLSRKKTREEFEISHRTMQRCITGKTNTIVPFWIYDKYADSDIPSLLKTRTSLSNYHIDPGIKISRQELVYASLRNAFALDTSLVRISDVKPDNYFHNDHNHNHNHNYRNFNTWRPGRRYNNNYRNDRQFNNWGFNNRGFNNWGYNMHFNNRFIKNVGYSKNGYSKNSYSKNGHRSRYFNMQYISADRHKNWRY